MNKFVAFLLLGVLAGGMGLANAQDAANGGYKILQKVSLPGRWF